MAKTKKASAAHGSRMADLRQRGESSTDAGQTSGDDLPDEQKFAGVTAGLIVRNDPAWASVLATPLESLSGSGPRGAPLTDILARKGEARPSPIAGPNAPAPVNVEDAAPIAELERLQEEMLAAERYFEEAEAALASAESQCQASEAARIAAAAAQESLQQALAETRAAAAIRDETHTAELRRMRDKIATLESELEARAGAQAEALHSANAARRERDESHAAEMGRLRGQLFVLETKLAEREAAFTDAEIRMKAGEAERLGALEAEWKEKLAEAVLQARADAAGLADDSRAAQEQALAEDEKSWRAEESARFAEHEVQIRQEYEAALAEAQARHKESEAERARVRRGMETARDRDQTEMGELRAELAALRTTCLDQKQELASMRAERGAQETERPHTKIVLQPDHYGRAAPRHAPPPAPKRAKRRIAVEAAAVAALAASAILFYPGSRNMNPAAGAAATTQAKLHSTAAANAPKRSIAVVDHGGNLRAGASGAAGIVGTLSHGMRVEVLEEQGAWTHVRLTGGADSQPLEGWIYGRFLVSADQDNAASAKPPSPVPQPRQSGSPAQ